MLFRSTKKKTWKPLQSGVLVCSSNSSTYAQHFLIVKHCLLSCFPFQILYAFLELIQPPKSPNPFAERFKYDIISSSLLSPTLQTPHHRSTRTPPIPGHLHSRNSSVDTSSTSPPLPPPHPSPEEPNYTTSSLLAIATAFFYLTDHTFLTLVSSVAVAFSLRSLYIMNDSSKIDMTPVGGLSMPIYPSEPADSV